MELPKIALSVNQPWAHLITSGAKLIENRTWNTTFRGEFLIHAGLKVDVDCANDLHNGTHPVTQKLQPRLELDWPKGGMVGIARIVDVIKGHADLKRFAGTDTSYFVGRYGFVLVEARPIEFIPCVGARGWFEPDYSKQYKPQPERKPKVRQAKDGRLVVDEEPLLL